MHRYPSRDEINAVKDAYWPGARVELIVMNDPYSKLVAGDKGTVDHVDDMGTIHVRWDNGEHLGVALGVDKVNIVNK